MLKILSLCLPQLILWTMLWKWLMKKMVGGPTVIILVLGFKADYKKNGQKIKYVLSGI